MNLIAIRTQFITPVISVDLIALRKTTDGVLNSLLKSADRVPFGIRYVGREVFRALQVKFPNESEEDVMRVVAHLVYYRFLQPAIVYASLSFL